MKHEYPNYARGHFQEVVSRVYVVYQKILKENAALDFDDLILKTVELFKKNPEILEKYQNKFQYILVDEYQDTNHAQYLLQNCCRKNGITFVLSGIFPKAYIVSAARIF